MSLPIKSLVPTGIKGLDTLLGGGLPKGRSILVRGGPGTGKTILGCQFLCNGFRENKEPGILVSLEESTQSLLENLAGFDWNIAELLEEGKLIIIDASPTRSSQKSDSEFIIPVEHPVFSERKFSIDSIISLIHSARRKIKAKRVLIDCITNLLLQYESAFLARQDIVTLLKSLNKNKLTTLLTAEYYPEIQYSYSGIEPFLVDGVISLSLLRHGNTKIRSLELMKMRGMKHSMDSALVRITTKGIETYPDEPVFAEDTREKIW